MRHLVRLVLVLVLALGGCGGGEAGAPADEALGPVELVEALRGGGYVLYLRHGATDMSQEDTHKTDVCRCDGMRNLTERGRRESRALGRAFEELAIPVGAVHASAYCRTRETADLAFGGHRRSDVLTGFPDPGDAAYEARVRATRELLARPPADGENTVLVAHVKNLEAAAEVTLDEGELVVFEPLGGTGFRLRGRIPAAAWPQLVERLRPGP